MTKTDTEDVRATLRQIRRLENAGCEIVRCAVPTLKAAEGIALLKGHARIPLVADVHYDYRIALASLRAGADKIRINPGNIRERWEIEEIIRMAADRGVPIRIGINSGSLPKAIVARFGRSSPDAMVAALEQALEPFERMSFRSIVISVKGSDVRTTVEAYEAVAKRWNYPLHIGLTESGLPFEGAIRSSALLTLLLGQGIGDTIRISLTGEPVLEVRAGFELLRALRLREGGVTLISCPTCGRCKVNLVRLARDVKKKLDRYWNSCSITVAVMGCPVNGPGEASEADYGIACGDRKGVIFERGRVIRTCPEERLVEELVRLFPSG